MRRLHSIICLLVISSTACLAQPWQRNTFPGKGHYDNGYSAGYGWDHVEAVQDLEVSPLNAKFMAFIDNEWSAVISTDGQNFKPIHMSNIGSSGCKIEDIEFSRYDASTVYAILATDYWNTLLPEVSPAGIWRSSDLGETWEHIYSLPNGAYERYGNYPDGTHLLEDPNPSRSNHIYFGSTSHGIVRSVDGGNTWQNLVPALANRCIKMIEAGKTENGETYIYAIAERKMPVHEQGKTLPLEEWLPANFTEQWKLNKNFEGLNGNDLEGTVSGWSESSAYGPYAAVFNGVTDYLAIKDLNYAGNYTKLAVCAWVKTNNPGDQVIASFDKNAYWQLGINGSFAGEGKLAWTVFDSQGIKHELASSSRIDDGDWHLVIGSWDNGNIQIYVDGEEEAFEKAATTKFGSGLTRYGFLSAGSISETYGDGSVVLNSFFDGILDNVKIYNATGFSQSQARAAYLESAFKYPVVQGSLWRIKIDNTGSLSEAVRLQTDLEDFVSIEVNPADPSRGWVIRKGYPNGWPYGGREACRFSEWGEKLTTSSVNEENSDGIYKILINPADTAHIFLRCGGTLTSGLRYSRDGGETWNGINRPVIDGAVPSLQSWTPRNYKQYGLGITAENGGQPRGTETSFVPGAPNEIIFIHSTNGLMRSADYGATFTGFGAGGSNKDLGQLAVAPGNPDHWGTCSFEYGFITTSNDGLYWLGSTHENDDVLINLTALSENAGNNWTFARTGSGIAFHPYDSDQIIATYTKEGFIIRSSDAGKTWTYTGQKNPTTEATCVFWPRTEPQRVYAGSKKSTDGGITWANINKNVVAVSDANPDLIVGVDATQRDIAASSLLMYISVDGGDTWTSLPGPMAERVPGTMLSWQVIATTRTFGLMAMDMIAIDPSPEHDPGVDSENLPRLLLAGRSGLYEYIASKSDGSGSYANWKICKSGIEPNQHYCELEPVPWMGFVIFDPRPGFENIVYAAKTNDVQTLDDWSGEKNKNHSYPGGDNFEPFYISRDGGLSWEKLHGENYPDAPKSAMIHSVEVDSYGRFYAATCEGIYHIAVDGISTEPQTKKCRVGFTIRDEVSGKPVSGCSIELGGNLMVTDEQGKATVDSLEHKSFNLLIRADGYASIESSNFEVAYDAGFEFNLKRDWPHLTVKLLDLSSGEPVNRAVIHYGESTKITNSEGEAYIGEISPGYWQYTVEGSNYFSLNDSVKIISDTTLNINLTNTLADIQFEIRNNEGPISNVKVNLNEYSLTTDFEGIVTYPKQPARIEYSYNIEEPGYKAVHDTLFLEKDTTVSILLVTVTGYEPKSAEYIKVYPNPVCNILSIYLQASEALLKIEDLDGKIMKSQNLFSGLNELDVSALPPGIYFLMFQIKQENLVKQLIISQ